MPGTPLKIADPAKVARSAFNLEVDSWKALPGDEECNVFVETPSGEQFLLRLLVSGLPRGVTEFQRDLIEHAVRADPDLEGALQRFSGPEPIRSIEFDGRQVDAALMRFLPGTLVSDVRPHSPELLRGIGALIGRLDRALMSFEGRPPLVPTSDDAPSWTLTDGPNTIRPRLRSVPQGPLRRDLVTRILEGYEARVVPHLDRMRTSVIHQDANDNNLLASVQPKGATVSGLIDFGDAAYTITAADPAIAAAYAAFGKRDPLTAMAHVIAGYDAVHPLDDLEFDALFDLALLRLAVSVTVSSERAASEEGASEYHLVSQAPAWRALEQLADVHPRFAAACFRDAAGRAPTRAGEALGPWAAAQTWSPILGASIADAPRVDLSLTSPLLLDGARDLPLAEWGQRVEALRCEADAICTVGYFDEARLLYETDAFSEAREDRDEPRTVHLGVDLFAPAGTQVHAPCAGRVASVARNGAALDYGPTLILEHDGPDGSPFWTLYGHLDGEVLTRLSAGDTVEAGAVLARFGAEEENGGWPPHLHFQVITDLLGHTNGDYPGVAAPSRRRVWTSLCPDPAPLLGLASCASAQHGEDELLAQRHEQFCTSMSISYDRPLAMARGRGTTMFDAAGRSYVDAVNNVPHVGHCHPRVVEAAQRQMALLNTNTRYLNPALHRYAGKLRAKLPKHLEVIYFVSSGSEANEVALRLAKAATGNDDLLVQEHGYHGHTGATVSSSHYKFARKGGFERPHDRHVIPVPDPVRGIYRGPESGPRYVEEVERILARLAEGGRRPRGILAEAIIGCGGQVVPPTGYLKGAFDAVRRAGGVAIADEVQVGFGRVGTHFWAFDEQGAVPDIVTMGKPMGNAHPLAAVATTREIAGAFAGGMEFFATFGGNNVSVAIGEAVLDVIDSEDLMANARGASAAFFEAMTPVAARHALVADVRGRGLYLGVELVDPKSEAPATDAAHYVANRMRDRGFLISTDGPHANVLKIKPPIVIAESVMLRLVQALDDVLGESPVTL